MRMYPRRNDCFLKHMRCHCPTALVALDACRCSKCLAAASLRRDLASAHRCHAVNTAIARLSSRTPACSNPANARSLRQRTSPSAQSLHHNTTRLALSRRAPSNHCSNICSRWSKCSRSCRSRCNTTNAWCQWSRCHDACRMDTRSANAPASSRFWVQRCHPFKQRRERRSACHSIRCDSKVLKYRDLMYCLCHKLKRRLRQWRTTPSNLAKLAARRLALVCAKASQRAISMPCRKIRAILSLSRCQRRATK
mmetsp:Transcript_39910/g.104630  ORF Transcript_39910/g.104630 Transcript_39910/m.104630 type:complete len:252 (+) Transcript_39910:2472-3227(+)